MLVLLTASSPFSSAGQLGQGTSGAFTNIAILTALPLPSGASALSVSLGSGHTVVLLDNGASLFATGRNHMGLGVGRTCCLL